MNAGMTIPIGVVTGADFTRSAEVKLNEWKKQAGFTLPLNVVEAIAEIPKNYLNGMWNNGEKDRVQKIVKEAHSRFESIKFNYKTIR